FEALVDPVEVSFNGQVPADEVAIELKVLPIEPEMHGRRVDFLDDARAPAVDRGIGEEHLGKSRASLLRTYAALGEGVERAPTQIVSKPAAAADVSSSQTCELMLVLPTFAKEHGRAKRGPSPPDTSLHVPDIGVVRVATGEIAIIAWETKCERSSVVLLMLI